VKTRPFLGIAALSVFLLVGFGGTAKADFSLSLNVSNGAGTGPYASMSFVQTNSTTLTVTVTALNNGGNFYVFSDLGLSLAAGVSVGSVTGHVSPFGSAAPTINGPGNFAGYNGFGKFNYELDGPNGSGGGYTSLTFTLLGFNMGMGNGSAYLANNDKGHLVATHIYQYSTSTYSGTAAFTGFATNGGGPEGIPSVPAPPVVVLLASGGFCGLGGFVFRRRRK
jgi:hypothetical protein